MNLPPLKRIDLSASLDSVKRNLVLNFRKLFSIDEFLLTLKNFSKDAVYEIILNGINHIQSLKELCKHIDFLKLHTKSKVIGKLVNLLKPVESW